MYLELPGDSQRIKLIGDPHFGRQFLNGTPLHRRGERERSMSALFSTLLHSEVGNGCDCNTVVIMGDLFDAYDVGLETLNEVYAMLDGAASLNRNVEYIVLMGNHDVNRQLEKTSSFVTLARMLQHRENVLFVDKLTAFITRTKAKLLLVPYDPIHTPNDLLVNFNTNDNFDAVFGHWDLESFGQNHNLMPYQQLARLGIKEVVNGHVHSPDVFWLDEAGNRTAKDTGKTRVTIVGSMQPYSHGEDKAGKLYLTEHYADALAKQEAQPGVFHDKCLRVLYKPNETINADEFDCLQFTAKRLTETDEREGIMEAKIDDFDLKALYDRSMNNNSVPEDLQKDLWDKYRGTNDQ